MLKTNHVSHAPCSPEKKPRNIQIKLENILNTTHLTSEIQITDACVNSLVLNKMYQCKNHSAWTKSLKDDDNTVDPQNSVIRTLILEHLGGCDTCKDMIENNNVLKSHISFAENHHSISFLKNQILCNLNQIQQLKDRIKVLEAEIKKNCPESHDCVSDEDPKPILLKETCYIQPTGTKLIEKDFSSSQNTEEQSPDPCSTQDFLHLKVEVHDHDSEDVTESTEKGELKQLDDIDDLLEDSDDDTSDAKKHDSTTAAVPKIKLRSFKELQKKTDSDSDTVEASSYDNQEGHSWTMTEEPPPEVFYVLGGEATSIAPGSQVVSSNVRKTTCRKSSLPKGVYLFKKENCPDAILVVKEETEETRQKILENINVAQLNASIDLFRKTVKKPAGVSDVMFDRYVLKKWNLLSVEEMSFYINKSKTSQMMTEKMSIPKPKSRRLYQGSEGLPQGWSRRIDNIGVNSKSGDTLYKVSLISPYRDVLHTKDQLFRYLKQRDLNSLSMSMFSFSAFKTPETTDLNSDEEDSELIRELDQLNQLDE